MLYAFSVILDQQIKDAGGAVELLTYRNDNHNISNNLSAALRQSVQFFDKHVKNAG